MLKIGLLILFMCCSDVLALVNEEFNDVSNTNALGSTLIEKKDKTSNIDYEKRKEIVKNYLETLNKAEDDWVDPYDMLSNDDRESLSSQMAEEPVIHYENKPVFSEINSEAIVTNVIPKDETDTISNDSSNLFSNHRQQISISEGIYISRWLKMLNAKIETDSYFEPSALVIPLNSDSLSELKTMSTETVNMRELDELISNLISKATVTSKEENNWIIFSSSFGVGLLVFIAFGLISYLFYICMINRPILTLIYCVVNICIFWHWMHLYQKQVAFKHSLLSSTQVPSECRKNDFDLLESIHEYFKSFFISSDCSKYYEALMVDPVWEVSLSVAFSETISAMLVQPLGPLAKALNGFMKQLFDGLSLFSSLIVVLFLFLIIIMYFNYRVKLPLFMGTLEPCNPQRNYIEDIKHYKTTDAVCDLIQNVEKADRKVSDLLQDELHKELDCDSSRKSPCNENVISKQDCQEDCKFILTRKESDISLESASKECITDQVVMVRSEFKDYNICKHLDASGKLCIKNNVEGDICIKTLSLSNSELSELTDAGTKSVKNDAEDDICTKTLSNSELSGLTDASRSVKSNADDDFCRTKTLSLSNTELTELTGISKDKFVENTYSE